jgi:hypothetical protein
LSAKKEDGVNDILDDIRTYVRMSAAATVKQVAKDVIDTSEKAQVYYKLNGYTAQSKIAEDVKTPPKTVSNWVGLFIEAGLASEPTGKFTSQRALFTLRELGVNLTQLKQRKPAKLGTDAGQTSLGERPSTPPTPPEGPQGGAKNP